jgi:DUF971 family protein
LISPVKLKRLKSDSGTGLALSITWSDGNTTRLSAAVLRDNCPCATCDEQRGGQTHANPLGSPRGKGLLKVVNSTAEEGYDLQQIWGIGNYAVGIQWGDGHNSGIYSFKILKELCDKYGQNGT